MPRLKWFLAGVALTIFMTDWARLRIERAGLFHEAQRAITIAEQRGTQVTQCLAALEKSKDLQDTAQVAYLARVQTLDEVVKAKNAKYNFFAAKKANLTASLEE
jgi:hypothetical protein